MGHDNGVLAGLPLGALQRLQLRFETVSLARGHTLYELGDPVRFAYQMADAIDLVLHLGRCEGARLTEEVIRVQRYDGPRDRYETDVLYARDLQERT